MRFVRRFVPTAEHGVDLAFAVALTVVALLSFQSSFGGTEFLIVGLVGVLLGAAISVVSDHMKLPVLPVIAVLFVGYVVVGGVVALRDQALLGFLPSLATLEGASVGSVVGWKELLTTVPPVGDVGNLMVLPFFCGIFSVGLSYLMARRLRMVALAALPPLAVLALGILCGIDEPVSVVLHGGVFAALVIVWFALRVRRRRPVIQRVTADRRRRLIGGVALVSVATAVGLVVGPSLPMADANDRVILRDTLIPPFDPFDYPSPLASYRRFIKPLEERTLFTIEGLPEGVPIRLATMNDFDGVVWRVTGGSRVAAGASGYFERVGTNVDPQFDGERANIRVTIGEWAEVWLPTVGEVVSLRFEGSRARELNEAFRYNRATDTGASQGRLLQPGDSYEMVVVLPRASADVPEGTLIDDRTNLGSDQVPDALTTWAAPVVQKVTDPYGRVGALATELEAGYYSDGENDQLDSLGGHSSGRLTDFVEAESLVGNAEQYAATLGLMLRGIEIPSRVVMGFIPKDWADEPIDITGFQTEAWVEVPVADVGWVHFASTPDRSRKEPETSPKPKPLPERNTQVPPPPAVLAEDPRSEPARESAGQKDAKKPEIVDDDDGGGLSQGVLLSALVVGVPTLILGSAAGVILWLKSRRRRRRRLTGSGSDRVSNGFREVVDAARDLGRAVPTNSTRRELAGFVGSSSAPQLASAADAVIFGPGEASDELVEQYWSEVTATIGDMRGQVGVIDRVKATVSLTSLRRE